MNIKKALLLFPTFFILLIERVSAHCPLCTAGAAVAAGGAAWLGVSKIIIGLFIGAFAVSTGWWFSRLIKKQYIPGQRMLIILLAFVTTIVPLLPLLGEIHPLYISIMGSYGSLLNKTYLLDLFLVGSIVGGAIVSSTPWLSSKITKLRGKTFPFQGIILTFAILIIMSIFMQLLI